VSTAQAVVLALSIIALGVAICWAAERADGRARAPQPMFQRYGARSRKRRNARALLNLAVLVVAAAWAANACSGAAS
jgi:hypothetical protein